MSTVFKDKCTSDVDRKFNCKTCKWNAGVGVVDIKEDHVEVKFEAIDKQVKISSYKFSVYSLERGMDVANRNQIPFTLAFAITAHKAQDLTLK